MNFGKSEVFGRMSHTSCLIVDFASLSGRVSPEPVVGSHFSLSETCRKLFGSCRKLSEIVGSCRKLSEVVGSSSEARRKLVGSPDNKARQAGEIGEIGDKARGVTHPPETLGICNNSLLTFNLPK
jgi:hypothetical protein